MAPETRSARSSSADSGDPRSSTRSARRGEFRKEGEYWTVGCGGNSFRLKDSKGLGYLAHLLCHPGVEFHVLDLVGGIASKREEDETSQSVQGLPRGDEDLEKAGIHIGGLGDAGDMLDDQAKVAYRRRLSELREELEEAKELGRVESAEQAEEERSRRPVAQPPQARVYLPSLPACAARASYRSGRELRLLETGGSYFRKA